MTVRLEGINSQAMRVVVDTNLSMPTDAKMLKQAGQTVVMTCSTDEGVLRR